MGVSDNLAESGFVPAYGLVTAKFVTHQRAAGGTADGVPVQGRVVFTPTARVADAGTKRIYVPAPVTGWLRDGVLWDAPRGGNQGVRLMAPSPGAVPSEWGYRVEAQLRDVAGCAAQLPYPSIYVRAGVTLDLATVAPAGAESTIPAPVPVKGEPGGLDAEAAALVQRLASGVAPRDTGWRREESPAIAAGALFYRRVGDWCIIAARGGQWDTITVHDRPDIPDVIYRDVGEKIRLSNNVPPGWQSNNPVLAPVVTDTGEPRGIILLHSRGDGNRITWRRGTLDLSPQNRSNLRCGLLIYPASDPFPTVLPGTPA